MMTKREKIAKSQIIDQLLKGGYKTYAELFDLFELHLTTRPGVVGYMLPDMAEIWISEYLDIEQVSLIVRHEILHEYYEHLKRYKEIYKNGKLPANDPFMNVAADYEISNVGYTEKDKVDAKRIKIGNDYLEGLVTSIDRPELADKTFEEIYEVLRKESPESVKQPNIGTRGDEQLEEAERQKARAEALKEQAEELGGTGGSGDQSQGGGQSSDQEEGSSGRESGEDGADSESNGNGGDSQESGEGKGKKSRQKYDDEEYQKMTPEEKKKERARRRKEAAKKLKEEADKLIDQIEDVISEAKGSSGQKGGPGGPGDSDDESGKVFETPEEKASRAEAIKKIKEALADLDKSISIKEESTRAILKEKAAKAANDQNKYRNSPLVRFTESLNRFIKDSIARGRNDSWSHINKKYVNSGLLKPGSSYSSKNDVPLINVYFDRSGSWDAGKTETGKQAISTLYKYQTRGEVKIKLYYFDTKVKSEDVGLGGGTSGTPIIEHIKQTKPTNVIILTDGDISDIRESVTVPGAVWILFYPDYGGVVWGSPNLVKHLKGRKLTRVFTIGDRVDLAPGITASGWTDKGE